MNVQTERGCEELLGAEKEPRARSHGARTRVEYELEEVTP